MILINGVKKEFTAEEKKKYGKKNAYVLKKSLWGWDALNKKMRYPAGYHLETFYSAYDPDLKEKVSVQYAETENAKPDGKKVYAPDEIDFNLGRLIATEKQIDLNYFMQNHPSMMGNPHSDPGKPVIFYKEDLHQEADDKAGHIEKVRRAQSLIWDKELAYDESTLRTIAISENLGNVNEMNFNEVRLSLDVLVQERPEILIDTIGKNQKVYHLDVIRKAEEKGVIKKFGRMWFYTDEDGEAGSKIIGLKPGEDAYEGIKNYMSNRKNDDEFLKLKASLEIKEGEPAKELETEE
jgi:hypothetical protein